VYIKIFKNNINNTNNVSNKRNNAKYTKPVLSFLKLGSRALVTHQQLPGSTRKSRTGQDSRQELDSEMHGSEYGSRSEAKKQARSSSEASHG